jgi:molybdate transport system substrate-binding protein
VRACAFLAFLVLVAEPGLSSDTITVAVASNFSRAAAELSEKFAGDTGVTVRVSNGSTGKLYAQILNGAPFDVFLAADTERPLLLELSGHAVHGSRATYAEGALVLWSGEASDCLAALRDEHGGRVALANPSTAPYGKAAIEYLSAEGLWDSVSRRAVYGENINQALQFVATGNAAIGFIAKSQLGAPQLREAACTWELPPSSYSSLEQQAVLLARAADNEGALRFIEYLHSEAAHEILARHGYGVTR